MSNHTHKQYANIFTWKPNARENHIMFFLICLFRSTFIGSTNFLVFQLQLEGGSNPLVSGYNPREAPTPQFYGSNQKEATTHYVLWLRPEGGYNHLSLPVLSP
jgi:hypothetical protein